MSIASLRQSALVEGKLKSLRLIGDAEPANTISQAVYSGCFVARESGEKPIEAVQLKIERTYP